jgi:hypothetical protein
MFRVRFEKASNDPGRPSNLDRIKSWIPVSDLEIEQHNREYRTRMNLAKESVE